MSNISTALRNIVVNGSQNNPYAEALLKSFETSNNSVTQNIESTTSKIVTAKVVEVGEKNSYIVEYLQNRISAITDGKETSKYAIDDIVEILVRNGDFSEEALIIGCHTTSDDEEELEESKKEYERIGTDFFANLFKNELEIKLHTWYKNYTEYSFSNLPNPEDIKDKNVIKINIDSGFSFVTDNKFIKTGITYNVSTIFNIVCIVDYDENLKKYTFDYKYEEKVDNNVDNKIYYIKDKKSINQFLALFQQEKVDIGYCTSIETDIDKYFRNLGDYGIYMSFPLRYQFKNTNTGQLDTEVVYRDYCKFTTSTIVGTPYDQVGWAMERYYSNSGLKEENLLSADDMIQSYPIKIIAYVDNNFSYPDNYSTDKEYDIYFKDYEIYEVEEVGVNYHAGYYLTIVPDENSSRNLVLITDRVKYIPKLRYDMKLITNLEDRYLCYWFIHNGKITSSSCEGYHEKGGLGWERVNSGEEFDSMFLLLDWNDVYSKSKFKCVLVPKLSENNEDFNPNQVISAEFIVQNLGHKCLISIEPDNTTYNAHDTIKLKGTFFCEGVTDVSEVKKSISYDLIALNNGKELSGKYYVEVSPIEDVENSRIYHFTVATNNFSQNSYITFDFGVYADIDGKRREISFETAVVFIGEDSKKLVRGISSQLSYLYDINNHPPTNKDYIGEGAINLNEKYFDFEILDEKNIPIKQEDYIGWTYTWKLPKKDTLLVFNLEGLIEQFGAEKINTEDENYYIITSSVHANRRISYDLAPLYKKTTNNSVTIIVTNSEGESEDDTIDIAFLQTGEPGTNGSEYFAMATAEFNIENKEKYSWGPFYYGEKSSSPANEKIYKNKLVAYYKNEVWHFVFPSLLDTLNDNELGELNENAGGDIYPTFNAVVWNSKGEKIAKGLTERSTTASYTVTWSMQGENDPFNNKIKIPFTIDEDTGILSAKSTDDAVWEVGDSLYAVVQGIIKVGNGGVAYRNDNVYSLTGKETDPANAQEILYVYYPIDLIKIPEGTNQDDDLSPVTEEKAKVFPQLTGGFYEVIYDPAGKNPQVYYEDDAESNMFKFSNYLISETPYEKDINKIYKYNWKVSGNLYFTDKDNSISEDFNDSAIERGISSLLGTKINKNSEYQYINPISNYENNLFMNYIKVSYSKNLSFYNEISNQISGCISELENLKNKWGFVRARKAILTEQLAKIKDFVKVGVALLTNGEKENGELEFDPAECYQLIQGLLFSNYNDYEVTVYIQDFMDGDESKHIDFINQDSPFENKVDSYIEELCYKITSIQSLYNNQSELPQGANQIDEFVSKVIVPLEDLIGTLEDQINFYTFDEIEAEYGAVLNKKDILTKEQRHLNKIGDYEIDYIKPIMFFTKIPPSVARTWDGTSATIFEEDGVGEVIYAPQVFAGEHSPGSNDFRGIFIGKKAFYGHDSEGGNTKYYSRGMFAYYNQLQTLALNSDTGKLVIGGRRSSQIVIDPTAEYENPYYKNNNIIIKEPQALIYGGGFYKEKEPSEKDGEWLPRSYEHKDETGQGLLINLSIPEIRFGNGNFELDHYGNMYSAGIGRISGWTLTDNELTSVEVDKITGNFKTNSRNGLHLISGYKMLYQKKDENGEPEIDADGNIKGTFNKYEAVRDNFNQPVALLDGNKKAIYEVDEENIPAIYSEEHNSLESDKKGFYISHNGFSSTNNYFKTLLNEDGSHKTVEIDNKKYKIYVYEKLSIDEEDEGEKDFRYTSIEIGTPPERFFIDEEDDSVENGYWVSIKDKDDDIIGHYWQNIGNFNLNQIFLNTSSGDHSIFNYFIQNNTIIYVLEKNIFSNENINKIIFEAEFHGINANDEPIELKDKVENYFKFQYNFRLDESDSNIILCDEIRIYPKDILRTTGIFPTIISEDSIYFCQDEDGLKVIYKCDNIEYDVTNCIKYYNIKKDTDGEREQLVNAVLNSNFNSYNFSYDLGDNNTTDILIFTFKFVEDTNEDIRWSTRIKAEKKEVVYTYPKTFHFIQDENKNFKRLINNDTEIDESYVLNEEILNKSSQEKSNIILSTNSWQPPFISLGGHDDLVSTKEGVYIGENGISLGDKVKIVKNGVMYLGNNAVRNGGKETSGRYWTIDGNNNNSYITYNATDLREFIYNESIQKNVERYNSESVYIGTDGIRIGNTFLVDKDNKILRLGNLNSKYWELSSNSRENYFAYNCEADQEETISVIENGQETSQQQITTDLSPCIQKFRSTTDFPVCGWEINYRVDSGEDESIFDGQDVELVEDDDDDEDDTEDEVSTVKVGETETVEATTASSNNIPIEYSVKNINSIYLGSNGLRIGKKFAVSNQGIAVLEKGTIGGWSFDRNKLSSTLAEVWNGYGNIDDFPEPTKNNKGSICKITGDPFTVVEGTAAAQKFQPGSYSTDDFVIVEKVANKVYRYRKANEKEVAKEEHKDVFYTVLDSRQGLAGYKLQWDKNKQVEGETAKGGWKASVMWRIKPNGQVKFKGGWATKSWVEKEVLGVVNTESF